MFLDEGLDAQDVDSWHQTASILHSNGDAMAIAVRNERIVGVRGRGSDRVNRGRLGPKDLFGWQANNSPAVSPVRWSARTIVSSNATGRRR
jgi:hypothetical protein